MRLELILPQVGPAKIVAPGKCKYEGCEGKFFRFLQEVDKALWDTVFAHVSAHRYECLRCKQSFHVYAQGVSRAQTSDRVYGLTVMLYLLGLSYGAVSLALDALGVYLCKSRVYEVVQAAAERIPGLKRERVLEDIQTPALGGDVTSVKCNGHWLPLGLTVDDTTGLGLTLDALSGEDAKPPRAGERASIVYRLRLLFLDRWNLWQRLTCYRTWQGPQGETIDGTNNGAERAIGWWVKERYRTMRGYKRAQSAVNISRLLAWAGNHLDKGGADLVSLIARETAND